MDARAVDSNVRTRAARDARAVRSDCRPLWRSPAGRSAAAGPSGSTPELKVTTAPAATPAGGHAPAAAPPAGSAGGAAAPRVVALRSADGRDRRRSRAHDALGHASTAPWTPRAGRGSSSAPRPRPSSAPRASTPPARVNTVEAKLAARAHLRALGQLAAVLLLPWRRRHAVDAGALDLHHPRRAGRRRPARRPRWCRRTPAGRGSSRSSRPTARPRSISRSPGCASPSTVRWRRAGPGCANPSRASRRPPVRPAFEADGRTAYLPVRLEPGRTYVVWLNSEEFQLFRDLAGQPAPPLRWIFTTAPAR